MIQLPSDNNFHTSARIQDAMVTIDRMNQEFPYVTYSITSTHKVTGARATQSPTLVLSNVSFIVIPHSFYLLFC